MDITKKKSVSVKISSESKEARDIAADVCLNFLSGSCLKVQTTNIQEIYNHYQHFDSDHLLILDFRSKTDYEKYHIVDSISVPYEDLEIAELLEFDEARFTKKYCQTQALKDKFKKRKR